MLLLNRSLLILILITGYLYLLRPARVLFNEALLARVSVESPYIVEKRATGVYIAMSDWPDHKKLLIKSPFGMYFLLGMSGLVLIGGSRKNFIRLAAIHSVIWLLAYLFFLTGSAGFFGLFRLMDLCVNYLLPIFTLGYVPFVYLEQRNKHTSLNEENT